MGQLGNACQKVNKYNNIGTYHLNGCTYIKTHSDLGQTEHFLPRNGPRMSLHSPSRPSVSQVRLLVRPRPIVDEFTVFNREGLEDWAYLPKTLQTKTATQMNILGKLYDCKFYHPELPDPPIKLLGANMASIGPMKQFGLITDSKSRTYSVRLTTIGRRVYEASYYYEQWQKDQRRQRAQDKLRIRRGEVSAYSDPELQVQRKIRFVE